MTKVSKEIKEAIQKDKESMTTRQLQEKYGLSRSSIQRVKPNLDERVAEFSTPSKPEPAKEAFAEQFVKNMEREVVLPTFQPEPEPDRQPIIQRIILNLETFPAHYPLIDKNTFNASLSTKTAAQLQDLLTTMERTRTTNNMSAQMKQVFLVSARAAEVLGARIRLKTKGLADALLLQQQELDYIFKELAISYADKFTKASSPELRLLTLFGMTVLQVDSQNRVREVMDARETEEKFADL